MSGLVQETSGSTDGTALTLTFPSPVTAGNTVILALAGYYGGSVASITPVPSGAAFVKAATSGGYNAEIWANYNDAAGSAAVAVTASEAGIIGYGYEVSGTVFPDQSSGAYAASGTTWNSGTTGTTVPWPHFAVGLGAALGGAGTIVPTASGWTDLPAYTATGGTVTTRAVSGYRQPSSSGTYVYSGTTATSSGQAAVTAAFATVPGADLQPAWGGYIFTEHAAAGYTGVQATFTMPESLPSSPFGEFAMWVGLGNVYQPVVFAYYSSSSPDGVYAGCWVEWIPEAGTGGGDIWDRTAFPVGAGDSVTLSATLDGEFWYWGMTNHSQDWSYTDKVSVLMTNQGSYGGTSSTAPDPRWIYPMDSAEVILEHVEAGSTDMADYGTVTFTGITTTPAATRQPTPVFTVTSTDITQYPGAYDLEAGSFTQYWNAYS